MMIQPKKLYFLHNPIKNYAWGSPNTLPTLLNYSNPDQEPQAELWMGTHPSGSSLLKDDPNQQTLGELIGSQPTHFLGEKAIHTYGKSLPFLYKVLAIKEPLSLQVHPNKQQAEMGFLAENQAGIALNDPRRSYQDDNHKTELICAYSDDFWALCGFLPYAAIIDNFRAIEHPFLEPLKEQFQSKQNSQTLKHFIQSLLEIPKEKVHEILQQALQSSFTHNPAISHWIQELIQRYPSDIACLSPLYMNLIHIPKGKALFVENGILHAYLQGTGVEIMALSDNVLRFGLTPKYIDMEGLDKIVRFEPSIIDLLNPDPHSGAFITPCDEFQLEYHTISLDQPYNLKKDNQAQIILCLEGSLSILHPQVSSQTLQKGDSIFVPYNAGDYSFTGQGEMFIASTPM